jgi:hypothetical protein
VSEFTSASSIRAVLEGNEAGGRLLYEHGYDIGSGFVDGLSQYQTLDDAAHGGRLRDVDGLLKALNQAAPQQA